VGAIFSAFLRVPILPIQVMHFWARLSFWGFLFISLGMRQIGGTEKELKYAQFFTMLSLLLRLGLPWIPGLLPPAPVLALNLLLVFSPLVIFFWFFKSEYLWSPSSAKRMDWYIYSAIALVYLILNITLMLPMVQRVIPLNIIQLSNARQFVNLLYNIVLVGLLVKLYLAAKNGTGPRWN
jgi:hypothetical protein